MRKKCICGKSRGIYGRTTDGKSCVWCPSCGRSTKLFSSESRAAWAWEKYDFGADSSGKCVEIHIPCARLLIVGISIIAVMVFALICGVMYV